MSRPATRDKQAPDIGTPTGRSAGGLRRGPRCGSRSLRIRWAGAGRSGRGLAIALLLALLLPLGSGGVWADPGDASHRATREDPERAAQRRLAERSRSLSPEARRAAREVYQAQLRLRAAVRDPRRGALLDEIRRAKELVPAALASRGGQPRGLPPKLEAQKGRIEGLLEELRAAYEGQPERLAELDRVAGGLQRMFDECEAIAGLPHGPGRAQRTARLLEDLKISRLTKHDRLNTYMASRVDPRAGRSPGLPPAAEPKVDVEIPSEWKRGKP